MLLSACWDFLYLRFGCCELLSAQGLWRINLTAPDVSDNRAYNLNVSARHQGVYNNTRTDLEYNSIVYSDGVYPSISIFTPIRIISNTTFNIKVNVTEAGGLKNITSNISYGNVSLGTVNLVFLQRIYDLYIYEANFSNTSSIGNYTIFVDACDLSNNCNSSNRSFEIYPVVQFAGYSKDYEDIDQPIINTVFIFYDPGTSDVRSNFSSNSSTGWGCLFTISKKRICCWNGKCRRNDLHVLTKSTGPREYF